MTRASCLVLIAGLLIAGCRPAGPAPVSASRSTLLPAGTRVRLVLLRELTSGGTAEGSQVPLLVAEDVKAPDGTLLIPRGAVASGKVAWSRREGTLGALMNQPARLAITVDETAAADGTSVKLTADPEGRASEPYQLTRANTGLPEPGGAARMLDTSEGEKLARELADAFAEGKQAMLGGTEETRRLLDEASARLRLSDTRVLLRKGEIGEANRLIDLIKDGASGGAILSGGSLTAVGAVLELSELAGQAGSRLSRMLKGRNIRAYVGTRIDAAVVEDAMVRAARP